MLETTSFQWLYTHASKCDVGENCLALELSVESGYYCLNLSATLSVIRQKRAETEVIMVREIAG